MTRQLAKLLSTGILAALLPGLAVAQTMYSPERSQTTDGQATGGSAYRNSPPHYVWDGAGGVVCPGGFYGGAHPFNIHGYPGPGYYGFFRRYWGYPFYGPYPPSGPANNFLPCFSRRQDPPIPHYAGFMWICANADGNCSAPPTSDAGNPPATTSPGKDATPGKAAHLQLLVPEDAEVLIDGGQTRKRGPVREFVSPPLRPGEDFTYDLTVRYTDADGKPVEETRHLQVRANDQLRIDCTTSLAKKQHSTEQPVTVSAVRR
jgi:uncharacterized protein (TIGR03000 family)